MDLIGHHFIVASRWQHQQAHMDVDNDKYKMRRISFYRGMGPLRPISPCSGLSPEIKHCTIIMRAAARRLAAERSATGDAMWSGRSIGSRFALVPG